MNTAIGRSSNARYQKAKEENGKEKRKINEQEMREKWRKCRTWPISASSEGELRARYEIFSLSCSRITNRSS
jgi:hypothetical protein